MSKDAKQLLTYIAYDPATVDELALRSGLDLPLLYTCLMELELKGLISMTSGGYVLSAT
jgi:predicted Rossmann fold nucleotide-binding protein DprA/Smf involved in DNA uptake